MEQNPIRYQDLISPDDSIEKLISQLEQVNTVYSEMVENIKKQAADLVASLQKVSGATEQGKKSIKESNTEAARLEKAYKALERAIGENSKEIARLNVVRRQANNYNKNIVLRGKEEIKTREQIKNASYQQLSAQYALNKAYINSLTADQRKIESNRKLIQSTKEMYEQMKRLQGATGKMQLNVGNYPQFESMLGGLVGFTGKAGAALAAINALKSGVGVAMDFQYQLSGLAAILGTTKDKIEELTAQARDLGATTIFTATEVVQLQTELAKLGYSTENILKMTPSVLQFSQATGASLADAASLTGAALRMFEKDASSTQDFVDKMTASTTKSALSFSYLQNALSTVSPVANAFGFKLEEVLALLGQLANAGFDASSAATATRNILLNLADANGKLAKALGQPVTNLDELIKGLKSLNDRGIDLAESLDLTDKRSVAAFNTFLAGTGTVIDLRDELVNCNGAAKQMAETMGDNLTGSVKTLQSAWQDFMIELNGSQGAISTMVTLLTALVRAIDKPFKWFNERTKNKRKQAIANKNKKAAGSSQILDENGLYLGIDTSASGAGDMTIYKPNEQTQETGTKGTKNKKAKELSEKEKKKAEAARKRAEAARKAELKEQEKSEKDSLSLRRKYEDTMLELISDEYVKERAKVEQKYEREKEDLQKKLDDDKNLHKLSAEDKKNINDTIIALDKARDVELNKLAVKQDKKEKDEAKRKKREQEQLKQQTLRERERAIEMEYQTDLEGIEMLETSEKEKTRMRLEAEKERLKKLLALLQADGKKINDAEIALIKKQIEGVNNELEKNKKRNNDIYDVLGINLSDEKKEAINESLSYAMDGLNQLTQAFVDAADKKRQLADAEVERSQSVLEAELEARNKGYANEVDTARKELETAKKNQQKAIEQQRRAQKLQIALDTASQAANMITATSLIWKQLGFPWAIPALGVMWGSFLAAKIKAAQVTKMGSESYGDGTVELLQGGSHQSGRDIDLGRKSDGTRRRAEGGEYFAVINKRNSRKFRNVIPDVMHSLNDGTFAEKYMTAYNGDVNITDTKAPDISVLTSDVRKIREQGENSRYTTPDGQTIIIYKNLRRRVRR